MAGRILLRGGHVITVDPALGDIAGGDVLIEGDTIAQVGKDLSADAEVIDCSGSVVIPGFIDTHRHTWEAAIRSCAPDATLDDYFVEVLDSFAPLYRPEDVYASNLAGSLECINAGITTLVDWSHINNTPDHPDAGIQGLKESGIRSLYAYGSANTSLADYWFNSSIAIPRDDVTRIGTRTLVRRRSPDARARDARPGFARTTWSARSGGCARPRHPDHDAHRDGQARRQVEDGQAA